MGLPLLHFKPAQVCTDNKWISRGIFLKKSVVRWTLSHQSASTRKHLKTLVIVTELFFDSDWETCPTFRNLHVIGKNICSYRHIAALHPTKQSSSLNPPPSSQLVIVLQDFCPYSTNCTVHLKWKSCYSKWMSNIYNMDTSLHNPLVLHDPNDIKDSWKQCVRGQCRKLVLFFCMRTIFGKITFFHFFQFHGC